jgi:hypothetical protein
MTVFTAPFSSSERVTLGTMLRTQSTLDHSEALSVSCQHSACSLTKKIAAGEPAAMLGGTQVGSILLRHSSLDAFAAATGAAFAFAFSLTFAFPGIFLAFFLRCFCTGLGAAFHATTVGEGGWNGCDKGGGDDCDDCVFHWMWK